MCDPGGGLGHRHLGVRGQGGVVVDRRRRGRARPQCPCEVNSSRHRSLITTVASPTSATTSRMATLRMPSGSMPPEPVASSLRRHAEEHDARRRRPGPPRPPPCAASPGSAGRTPGQRADRPRLGQPLLDEHRQRPARPGATPGLGDQPPHRRRAAQPARAGSRGTTWQALLEDDSAEAQRGRALHLRAAALLGRHGGQLLAQLDGVRRRAPRPGRAPRRAAAGRRPAGRTPSRSRRSSGPITATTVRACGLPAMPTRLRTVEDEVKSTASKPPDLIASRISAGGGAARTVRYAVTSSTSQPRSVSPAASVSVAMSARGSSTRPTGSRISSCGENSASRPSLDCSPAGISSGWMPNARTASAVASPMQAILTPPKCRASRPCSANFSQTARTALTEVKIDPGVPAVDQALDRPLHLRRGARRLDRDGRHLARDRPVRAQPRAHRAGLLLGPRDEHLPAVQRAVLPPAQLVALADAGADGEHHPAGEAERGGDEAVHGRRGGVLRLAGAVAGHRDRRWRRRRRRRAARRGRRRGRRRRPRARASPRPTAAASASKSSVLTSSTSAAVRTPGSGTPA